MPADSVTLGPIIVPAPMWMYRSLTIAVGGKQITLPLAERSEAPPRRLSGPIAPSSTTPSHAQRTSSPPARFIAPRVRSTTVGWDQSAPARRGR